MNKTDRKFHEVNRQISQLVEEACDFGRVLKKNENRDVVTWLGWKASMPELAAAKVAEIREARAEKQASASVVGKLAYAFAYAVKPVPFEDSATIQTKVRAEVLKKFNIKSKPPRAGVESIKRDIIFALKRDKADQSKGRIRIINTAP